MICKWQKESGCKMKLKKQNYPKNYIGECCYVSSPDACVSVVSLVELYSC